MNKPCSIEEIIARVYYDASLASSDMTVVVRLLEQLKLDSAQEQDVFKQWARWDDAVVRADQTNALEALRKGRTAFIQTLTHQSAHAILDNPESITAVFLKYLHSWRTIHFRDVLTEVRNKQSNAIPDLPIWLERIQLIFERRWIEMLPNIQQWKKYPGISQGMQAHFYAVEAAIGIFYQGEYEQSRIVLDEALALHATEPYVLSTDAAWYLEQQQLEEARKRYQSMVLEKPLQLIGLNGLGHCGKKADDFFSAEEWYLKAKEIAPGHLETYQNLLGLYSSEQRMYDLRKDKIEALVQTEILIEPLFEYEYYIDASYACSALNDIPTASHYNQRALSLSDTRYEGYLQQANLLKLQLPVDPAAHVTHALYVEAEINYRKSISLATTCFDGYWGLHIFYKQALQYPQAIQVLKEAYPHCKSFNIMNYMEITDCYEKMNDWSAASKNILDAITAFPDSDALFEHAEAFAERIAAQDASLQNAFQLSRDFYHALCHLIPEQKKKQFYTFITKSLSKRKNEEAFLVQIYQDALRNFPEEKSFQNELNHLQFLRKFHSDGQPFTQQVTEIVIECDALLCTHFLSEDRSTFTPDFLQKINQFKEQFYQRFGIQLPPLIFRQYTFVSEQYHFFSTLDGTYTTLGSLFHPELSLVRAETIPFASVETHTAYQPFFNLHWIHPEDEAKLPAEAVLLQPLDIIFEHLQYTLWQQMNRFIHFDQTEIKELCMPLSFEEKIQFLQVLKLLATYYVPLHDKASILNQVQHGMAEKHSAQQIAWQLLTQPSYQPSFPYQTIPLTYYRLGDKEEALISSWQIYTTKQQWAANTDPTGVQELLSAIRLLENPYGRCYVSEARTAWLLNSIASLEFPFFFFLTEEQVQPNPLSSLQTLDWL